MQRKRVLTLLLVVAITVPTATAGIPAELNSTTPTASVAESTAGNGSAADTTDGARTKNAADRGNYTQLYVGERYRNLELKPGESETLNVSVENGEDEAVTLSPHLFLPNVGDRPVDTEWVSIADDEVTVESGAEETVEMSVSVPEDAELGSYNGFVAFTDEMITYPGRPAQPVHAAQFNLDVWQQPTVTIEAGSYVSTQVQAGETGTHEIVVENAGDEAVPLNPRVTTDRNRRFNGQRETLDPSWFEIDAPSEIESGETATVEVTVSPPESADRGRYDAQVDLGLKDPARSDRNAHWQQVNLGVQVWKQPSEPFTTSFDVSERTDDASLTLETRERANTGESDVPPSFDVTFVSPNGTSVTAERVQRANSGNVDLGRSNQPRSDGAYATNGEGHTFTYRLDEPAAGEWSVRIEPHNAMQFSYEITRNESR